MRIVLFKPFSVYISRSNTETLDKKMHGGKEGLVNKWLPGAAAVASLVFLWWLAADSGAVPKLLLPSPGDVMRKAVEMTASGELAEHTFQSLFRVLAGFAASSALAFAAALFFYECPAAERTAHPVVEALRVVPPLSLVPLLILWLGIDEAPKYAIVILSSFFPVYLTTLDAFRQTAGGYLMLAQSLGLSRKRTLVHIIIPGAAPRIATGLRLGFGYAWRALVGAELLAASSGLGYLVEDASLLAQSDAMLLGIIAIAAWGVALDAVFTRLLNHACARRRRRVELPQAAPATSFSGRRGAAVKVEDLHLSFGEKKPLAGASFTVERGRCAALLGRSGAGKTTMVRVVAGLARPERGRVSFDKPSPVVSIVFQQALLLPWKNVYENIEAALLDLDESERAVRIREVLSLVGLSGEAASFPDELSGGMAQRVGMARALAVHPDVLLMDEPFGALDAITRRILQEETQKLLKKLGITVILITHDVREACIMADKAMILKDGRVASSLDVPLDRPRSPSDPALLQYEEALFREISAA